MMTATRIEVSGHDEVYRLDDPPGFVALHRTGRGPAFGGTRIRSYPDARSALDDALRLSRAMTLKCAVNDIPGGGGKAVLEVSGLTDRGAAIERYAAFVESLGGRFFTGPDLGLTADDLARLQRHTRFVVAEDLSDAAALGAYHALRGAFADHDGTPSPAGRRVAVQGLGSVGSRLARLLVTNGARVTASELDPRRQARVAVELGLATCRGDELLTGAADALAPCAVGGILSPAVVPTLATRLVCGAANNILDDDATAEILAAAGVTFVPDFISSSGATIQGAWEQIRGPGDYRPRILALEQRVADLLAEARAQGLSPLALALARWGDEG